MLILASGCGSEVELERQGVNDTVSLEPPSLKSDSESQLPSEHALFCTDCQLVDVTKIVDGGTLDTSVGRVRFFGVDRPWNVCSVGIFNRRRLAAISARYHIRYHILTRFHGVSRGFKEHREGFIPSRFPV